jgi:hypothetical protein
MTADAMTKDQLYRLIDAIPPAGLEAARRALEPLADPMLLALANAPIDDEPTTPEDIAAIEEERDAYRRGEWVADEDVRSEFGW